MKARDEHDSEDTRRRVRAVLTKKLEINKATSAQLSVRVSALTPTIRRERLQNPDDHVDPKRGFNTLSYLHGQAPDAKLVRLTVQRLIVPLLFD